MLVMDAGIVRAAVGQRLVGARMRVRLVTIPVEVMYAQVMRIVHMRLQVRGCLVRMRKLTALLPEWPRSEEST
jgi:hypothetical protein